MTNLEIEEHKITQNEDLSKEEKGKRSRKRKKDLELDPIQVNVKAAKALKVSTSSPRVPKSRQRTIEKSSVRRSKRLRARS